MNTFYVAYSTDHRIYHVYSNLHIVSTVQLYKRHCEVKHNLDVIFTAFLCPCIIAKIEISKRRCELVDGHRSPTNCELLSSREKYIYPSRRRAFVASRTCVVINRDARDAVKRIATGIKFRARAKRVAIALKRDEKDGGVGRRRRRRRCCKKGMVENNVAALVCASLRARAYVCVSGEMQSAAAASGSSRKRLRRLVVRARVACPISYRQNALKMPRASRAVIIEETVRARGTGGARDAKLREVN